MQTANNDLILFSIRRDCWPLLAETRWARRQAPSSIHAASALVSNSYSVPLGRRHLLVSRTTCVTLYFVENDKSRMLTRLQFIGVNIISKPTNEASDVSAKVTSSDQLFYSIFLHLITRTRHFSWVFLSSEMNK
jgi:hypothetical protein